MGAQDLPAGYAAMLDFPLVAALLGRRARRFAMGATIPDGALAYTSTQPPMPLSELERMLVLLAVGGNTGWNTLHMHNAYYAPHLPNYAAAAGGRTFPSGAAFHTSQIFCTDDAGTYVFATRDLPAQDASDLNALLEAHRPHLRKLSDHRLHIPAQDPFMEGHNTWIGNCPGSLFVIPVVDLAQHVLLGLCYYLQNGYTIYDDVHGASIPGLERFPKLVDPNRVYPLTFIEMLSLGECAVEIGTACYAGMLLLQAMGLGGWMYDGMDPFSILGASGDPAVPGLGFRYDTDDRWSLPNPTGLPGVMEGFCPPHYPDMRAAVEAVAERKFGPGGPFNPDTPGPWRESALVRGSAAPFTEEFKACVAVEAQYIFDRFGKFPGTVPSILALMYLQVQHLDLAFYDHFFAPGAYLDTHARHQTAWHGEESGNPS